MKADIVKVAVIDDHPMMLIGMDAGLCRRVGVEFVFGANSMNDFFEKMNNRRYHKPDVILIDVFFPDGEPDGYAILSAIKRNFPDIRTAMFSMEIEPLFVKRALALGANGYLEKSLGVVEIIECVQRLKKGETVLSPGIKHCESYQMLEFDKTKLKKTELTLKEIEVMINISYGLSRKLTAEKMHISVKTVDSHCRNLFLKTGVRNSIELLNYAIKSGWLTAGGGVNENCLLSDVL